MSEWPASNTPLYREWYVVGQSGDFARGLARRVVLGVPIALHRRQEGQLVAFVDRCPHRNVPLSAGHVSREGHLVCPYHGWEFSSEGRCVKIPGLTTRPEHDYELGRLSLREQQGLVWVCPKVGVVPEREPFELPLLSEPSYTTVIREVESPGSVHATAENALDVPHTAVLHRGLFRGAGQRNRVRAIVRRFEDSVEAEYVGEPAPKGLLGRILAVGRDGVVRHWDRFFLPSVLQVEYQLGESTHFVITGLLCPVEPHVTRLVAVATFRTPLPGRLVAWVLEPIGRMVFRQDVRILAMQAETIERFGEARFISTDIDTVGPTILRLMKGAFRREAGREAEQDDARTPAEARSVDAGAGAQNREKRRLPLATVEVDLDA